MRTLSLSLVPAVSLILGCADANPNAQGGEPLLSMPEAGAVMSDAAPVSIPIGEGGVVLWSDIYNAVLAPDRPTHCTGAPCHQMGGAASVYWVCGPSASACRQGLIDGMMIPANGAADFTTTILYSALHRPDCSPAGINCNMPLNGPTLTTDEITAITDWVQSGAPDN